MLAADANTHHVSPTNIDDTSHANAWPVLFLFFTCFFF